MIPLPLDTLVHGDCLVEMERIQDRSVDLILCDLPYGSTACSWDVIIPFEPLWRAYRRIRKPHAPIVLFGTQPFTSHLVLSNLKEFKYEWIWHKSKSGSAFTAKYRPLARHENVLVFGRGRVTYNPIKTPGKPYERKRVGAVGKVNNHRIGFKGDGILYRNEGFRYPETVQFFPQKWRRQDQLHPTQKPVELMEYLVKTYSNPGDLVLDNCAGSGTTCLAARNTGRHFIGMEKDPVEYGKACRRLGLETAVEVAA